MGALYSRMKTASPLWRLMRDTFQGMVTSINALRSIVIGLNPHLADDGTNTASGASDATVLTAEVMRDAHQAVYTAYEAHRAATANHAAADSTNTLAAEPTPKAVYDLLNQIKAKYNAHRILTAGSVHGAADSTNAVAAADATTKASAVTLANALRTAYEAHRILTASSVHGAADSTNAVTVAAVTSNSTWVEIAALADNLKTKYEAHRALTAGSVHGAADSTNAVTQEAVGTVSDRDVACVNDIKAKLNAHIILTTAHKVVDLSVIVAGADATTLAGAQALTVEVVRKYKNHISRAVYASSFPALAEL